MVHPPRQFFITSLVYHTAFFSIVDEKTNELVKVITSHPNQLILYALLFYYLINLFSSSSLKAKSNSSLVFITIGPPQAIGSFRGFPDISKNLIP